jgi:hypothetical protein
MMPRRRLHRPSRRKTAAAKLTRRRLSNSLSTLFDVAYAGDVAIGQAIPIDDAWTLLQFGMLLRAINAVKAARPLIVELHWEFAAVSARQIFELLVNAEYVQAQPDPAQAATRFTRFGFLQQTRARLEEMDYSQRTGRPVDPEARARVLELLADFDDLRDGKDHQRWPRSWSGHSTARLAEMSPRQPIRSAQYRQLFTAWSEQIHAAPAALIPAMFPEVDARYDQLLRDDLANASEVATMIVRLYLELWEVLPAIPNPGSGQFLRWSQALLSEARSFGPASAPASPAG